MYAFVRVAVVPGRRMYLFLCVPVFPRRRIYIYIYIYINLFIIFALLLRRRMCAFYACRSLLRHSMYTFFTCAGAPGSQNVCIFCVPVPPGRRTKPALVAECIYFLHVPALLGRRM